ncbi:MAG: YihY/virulence factor BrkB family protein [Sphingorhabdus sp.]
MADHSPLSPEARARRSAERDGSESRWFHRLDIPHQSIEILRRVFVGVYRDGFIHAGNFAYLSLISLFAFGIVAAAIAGALGESSAGVELIDAFFAIVPPSVGDALRGPIDSAMNARTGPILWFSAVVSLWTTASLIETLRDLLNRSYGTEPERSFLHYRLGSIVTIIGAVLLAMLAFSAQVIVQALEEAVYRFFPGAEVASSYFAWGQIIPFVTLFIAIYVIFRGLTPRKYRSRIYAKWPGAALVSLWWLGCSSLLPLFIAKLANYQLTYGSLAGVMVTLIFFYLIGLGMVTGAQLNAALANTNENGVKGGKDEQMKE